MYTTFNTFVMSQTFASLGNEFLMLGKIQCNAAHMCLELTQFTDVLSQPWRARAALSLSVKTQHRSLPKAVSEIFFIQDGCHMMVINFNIMVMNFIILTYKCMYSICISFGHLIWFGWVMFL